MDATDEKLIVLLKREPRATNRSLAAAVGLSEPTVAARIARLEEQEILRVMAVLDMGEAGFEHLVIFGIRVADRHPADVAAAIVAIPQVQGLTSTFGRFELVGTAFARDKADLGELLDHTIGMIPGVQDLESGLILQPKLFRADTGRITGVDHGGSARVLAHSKLDELDRGLVEALQENGRMSYREIGRRLATPEATVRSRLARLTRAGAIHLEAVTDMNAFGEQAAAWIALRVRGGALEPVSRQLCNVAEIGFVGTAVGRFNLLSLLVLPTREALLDCVFGKISPLQGIQQIETWEIVHSYKHDIRIGVGA